MHVSHFCQMTVTAVDFFTSWGKKGKAVSECDPYRLGLVSKSKHNCMFEKCFTIEMYIL